MKEIKFPEIREALRSFRLNNKEIALYLASLNLGEAGMSELSHESELNRSTAYLIFEALRNKGLMGSFRMRKGMRFVATRPEVFITKAKKQLFDLEQVLPQLLAFGSANKTDPKVTYYHGEEGYITAIEDSLAMAGATLRHIGSITEAHRVYEDYDFSHYLPERIRKNIFIRCLYANDVDKKIKNRDHGKEKREIRFLPPDYPLHTAMLIYGNKVVITSTKKELISIVIDSEDIARDERLKFDLIWNLIENKEKRLNTRLT